MKRGADVYHYACPIEALSLPSPIKQGREELLTATVERGPSNSWYIFKRSGQGCPLLRASSEHVFIARSASKKGTWPLLLHPSEARVPGVKKAPHALASPIFLTAAGGRVSITAVSQGFFRFSELTDMGL